MREKFKTPLRTEEKAQIATMTAGGVSQNKIAATLGRSRHLVKNTLALPETQRAVRDERQELAELYRNKARDVLVSIDDETISKGNLLQKATSSAILLDKALLLSGEVPTINVSVLLDVAEAIRARRDAVPLQTPILSLSGDTS